MYFRFRTCLSL